MNEGDFGLKRYLQDIGQFSLLTPQQEIELAKKIKKGDTAARERMINANLRLVVTIARDYANLLAKFFVSRFAAELVAHLERDAAYLCDLVY